LIVQKVSNAFTIRATRVATVVGTDRSIRIHEQALHRGRTLNASSSSSVADRIFRILAVAIVHALDTLFLVNAGVAISLLGSGTVTIVETLHTFVSAGFADMTSGNAVLVVGTGNTGKGTEIANRAPLVAFAIAILDASNTDIVSYITSGYLWVGTVSIRVTFDAFSCARIASRKFRRTDLVRGTFKTSQRAKIATTSGAMNRVCAFNASTGSNVASFFSRARCELTVSIKSTLHTFLGGSITSKQRGLRKSVGGSLAMLVSKTGDAGVMKSIAESFGRIIDAVSIGITLNTGTAITDGLSKSGTMPVRQAGNASVGRTVTSREV